MKSMKLCYGSPAQVWEKNALPIGNGRLGGMFFGGIQNELIQFNEETLFSGKPSQVDHDAYKCIPKIRELLKNGCYEEAQKCTDEEYLQPSAYGSATDFGSYQNFGELKISFFQQDKKVDNYVRELDIDNAMGRVSYTIGETQYVREYFCSYPQQVMVIHLSCNKKESLSAEFSFVTANEKDIVSTNSDGLLYINGNTGYIGFESVAKVISCSGKVSVKETSVLVENADSILILLSASTEYLMSFPYYKGNDYKLYNQNTIDKALLYTYDQLKTEHIKDYKSLYDRVQFTIQSEGKDIKSTDEMLENYKAGIKNTYLECLLFHYGRYLLISSSRLGTLPANLQGIWNNKNNPEWSSIFCYNINFNMNYWPAQVTNLSECHYPAIEFIDHLRESGRVSARAYFDANGWFASKKSDVWGFTRPYANATYGLFIGGSGWLCEDVWGYYDFTQDKEYLKNVAFDILHEAVLFYLDFLILNEDGYYVASPSTSPENEFKINGKAYSVCEGTEITHRIVQELFENYIKTCGILKLETNELKNAKGVLEKLSPVKVGRYNQIQEWYQDWDDPNDKHRHVSPIYGLHPAQVITPKRTPHLIDPIKTLLNFRGDYGPGWSRAWKISIWARLLDGKRAYENLNGFIEHSLFENLFCVHPPFQIDGNLGYTAGVAEMLVQSNSDDNEITFLHALPKEWESGSISGLCARGGFEVSFSWKGCKLEQISILSKNKEIKSVILKYGTITKELILKPNEVVKLDSNALYFKASERLPL